MCPLIGSFKGVQQGVHWGVIEVVLHGGASRGSCLGVLQGPGSFNGVAYQGSLLSCCDSCSSCCLPHQLGPTPSPSPSITASFAGGTAQKEKEGTQTELGPAAADGGGCTVPTRATRTSAPTYTERSSDGSRPLPCPAEGTSGGASARSPQQQRRGRQQGGLSGAHNLFTFV